ncbi:DegV family protein [Haploplasma axanthum]|uniref:DegV-like protein n=1 Tax=Haploplasma axanthum TaxID=29552 RepID=A0A449BBZ5_HAPAX|nr:DegV family protein [Haploplasma axanthum]VEU79959.1 degV-like protein [Haploplasma axanthum]
MIKVIIDSTCDLSEDYIKSNDIKMIPLQVLMDNIEYLDKTTVDSKVVYDAIKQGKPIKTSLPRYEDAYNTFVEYAKTNQEFICVAFSKKMSGTYDFLQMVLNDVKEEYPSLKASIIDSKTGSLSTTIVIYKMIDKIKSGSTFEEVVEYTKELTTKTGFLFVVNDLNQLVKGGRVSRLKAITASVLSIHPILKIQDGKIETFKNVIGLKRTLKELVKEARKVITDKDQLIGISYANNIELAKEVERLLREEVGCTNFFFETIGSVFAAHLGLGSVGISFFNKLD